MVAMVLLLLGTIQFALIYNAKTTLNYATYEAARYGSLHQADFEYIKEGFSRGLAPLHSYPKDIQINKDIPLNQLPSISKHAQVAAFQKARRDIIAEIEGHDGIVRIERISPTNEDFSHFATHATKYTIPNDNLRYRSSMLKGTRHRTVQDANILQLRVTYWYPLYVPIVNCLIYAVVPKPSGSIPGNSSNQNSSICKNQDLRIPLTSVSAIRMQSSAINSSGFYIDEH